MAQRRAMPIYGRLLALFLAAITVIFLCNLFLQDLTLGALRAQRARHTSYAVTRFSQSFEGELSRIQRSQQLYMLLSDAHAQTLNSQYGQMNAYRLGRVVAGLYDELMRVKLSSDYIKNVEVYMAQIQRVVSTGKYFSEDVSVQAAYFSQSISRKRMVAWYDNTIGIFVNAPSREDTPPYDIIVTLDDALIRNAMATYDDQCALSIVGDGWQITPRGGPEIPWQSLAASMTEAGGSLQWGGYSMEYRYSGLMDAYVVGYIGTESALNAISRYQRIQTAILILTVFIAGIGSIYLIRVIRRPFHELLGVFDRVEKGDLEMEIDYRGPGEFELVFERLDNTIHQLRALIQERYIRERDLQRAELRQLQAQIAPHFLYNCFNILRHTIRKEDHETAEMLTLRLGDHFRYITSNDRDEIPLREEYQFACNYLDLQKIRFQDRIHIDVEALPEEIADLIVPRMIIQPLIENAFKHGIQDMDYEARIQLGVKRTENELQIRVADNGAGLSTDELERVRGRLETGEGSGDHYGLANIAQRLRIHFPERGQLRIDGGLRQGFICVLCIPIETRTEG